MELRQNKHVLYGTIMKDSPKSMFSNTCIEYKRMKAGGNTSLVLKKSAWTAKEDMLLKNCIEKFGEGKWHLVPLKAGLNRCRKSCRLRWLNYLRPNIKKGDFDGDEVDLMLRLHKLLGNKWSLIAGRIPGRTANDVKNYWNTHLRSRAKQQQKEGNTNGESSQQTTRVTVIKPQPQTFSKIPKFYPHNIPHYDDGNLTRSSNDATDPALNVSSGLISSSGILGDNIKNYLDELFDDQEKEIDNKVGWSFDGEALDDQTSLFDFPCIDEVMLDLI